MRIGILTFHRALNYGAALQAFALTQKLNDLGVTAEVIDYRNDIIEQAYSYQTFWQQSGFKNKLKYLIQNRTEREIRERFEKFRNQYLLGENREIYTRDSVKAVAQVYSRVLVGSDQVWNPNATNVDTAFLLDFLKPQQKYSYAASFGISKLPEDCREMYQALLSEFQKRSVRETQGKRIIESLAMDAQVHIDPVYLLSKEQWNQKFKLSKKSNEKYVLVYSFRVTPSQIKMAKSCAKRGLKIKYIGNPVSNVMGADCEYVRAAGPVEFLELFYNATFVITNSFHGSSFSLLFNRPMAIEYIGNNVNSRLENLVSLFGIEMRLLNEQSDYDRLVETEPDWDEINKVIQKEQVSAEKYLKECLR